MKKKISAKEFDKIFEEGDITPHLNLKTIKIHNPVQRINVDFPQEMLGRVDREAARIGVPRTSLIKMWVAERLDHPVA